MSVSTTEGEGATRVWRYDTTIKQLDETATMQLNVAAVILSAPHRERAVREMT